MLSANKTTQSTDIQNNYVYDYQRQFLENPILESLTKCQPLYGTTALQLNIEFLIPFALFSNTPDAAVAEVNAWIKEATTAKGLEDGQQGPVLPQKGQNNEDEGRAILAMLSYIAGEVRNKGGKHTDVKAELMKWQEVINEIATHSHTPWQDAVRIFIALKIRPEFFDKAKYETVSAQQERWDALVKLAEDHRQNQSQNRNDSQFAKDLQVLKRISTLASIEEYFEHCTEYPPKLVKLIHYRVEKVAVGKVRYIASINEAVVNSDVKLDDVIEKALQEKQKEKRASSREQLANDHQPKKLDLSLNEIYALKSAGVLQTLWEYANGNQLIDLCRQRAIRNGVRFEKEIIATLQKYAALKNKTTAHDKAELEKLINPDVEKVQLLQEAANIVEGALDRGAKYHDLLIAEEVITRIQGAITGSEEEKNAVKRSLGLDVLYTDIPEIKRNANPGQTKLDKLKAFGLDEADIVSLNTSFQFYKADKSQNYGYEYDYLKISGSYKLTSDMLQNLKRAHRSLRAGIVEGLDGTQEAQAESRARKTRLITLIRLAKDLTKQCDLNATGKRPNLSSSICQDIERLARLGFNIEMIEKLILAEHAYHTAEESKTAIDLPKEEGRYTLPVQKAIKLFRSIFALRKSETEKIVRNLYHTMRMQNPNIGDDALYAAVEKLCAEHCDKDEQAARLYWQRNIEPQKRAEDFSKDLILSYKEICALDLRFGSLGKKEGQRHWTTGLDTDALNRIVNEMRAQAFQLQGEMPEMKAVDLIYIRINHLSQTITIANEDYKSRATQVLRAESKLRIALMCMGVPASIAYNVADPKRLGTDDTVTYVSDSVSEELYAYVKQIRSLHPRGGIITPEELELLEQVAQFIHYDLNADNKVVSSNPGKAILAPSEQATKIAQTTANILNSKKAELMREWLKFGANTDFAHRQGFKFSNFCKLMAKQAVLSHVVYAGNNSLSTPSKGGLWIKDVNALTELALKYELTMEQVGAIWSTDKLNIEVCEALLAKAKEMAGKWDNHKTEKERFNTIINGTFATKGEIREVVATLIGYAEGTRCSVSEVYSIVLQALINAPMDNSVTITNLTSKIGKYFSYSPEVGSDTEAATKKVLGSFTPQALLKLLVDTEKPLSAIESDAKAMAGRTRSEYERALNVQANNLKGEKAVYAADELFNFNLERGYMSWHQINSTMSRIGGMGIAAIGDGDKTLHNFTHWNTQSNKYWNTSNKVEKRDFKPIYSALVQIDKTTSEGVDGLWTVRDFERFRGLSWFSLPLFDTYARKHSDSLIDARTDPDNDQKLNNKGHVASQYQMLFDHYSKPENRKGAPSAKSAIINQVAADIARDYEFKKDSWIKWQARGIWANLPKAFFGLPIAAYHVATTGIAGSIGVARRGYDLDLESKGANGQKLYYWRMAGEEVYEQVGGGTVTLAKVALVVVTSSALIAVLRQLYFELAGRVIDVSWSLTLDTTSKYFQDTMLAHAFRMLAYQSDPVTTVGQLQDLAGVTISAGNFAGGGLSIAALLVNIMSVASIALTVTSIYIMSSRYSDYKKQQEINGEEVQTHKKIAFLAFIPINLAPLLWYNTSVSIFMETLQINLDSALIANALLLVCSSALTLVITHFASKSWNEIKDPWSQTKAWLLDESLGNRNDLCTLPEFGGPVGKEVTHPNQHIIPSTITVDIDEEVFTEVKNMTKGEQGNPTLPSASTTL